LDSVNTTAYHHNSTILTANAGFYSITGSNGQEIQKILIGCGSIQGPYKKYNSYREFQEISL
jgi:hypothetical protein